MSEDFSGAASGAEAGEPSDRDHLRGLADRLGLELPPFLGPLVVFDPAGDRSPGDPVYLGGDLHAVHPETGSREAAPPADVTLDEAVITLFHGDVAGETIEATSTQGIWCLALFGEFLASSLYFMLRDSDGRLRVWLLLPPADSMIGHGHNWLPRVPSA